MLHSRKAAAAVLFVFAGLAGTARAESIDVSTYGSGNNSIPWAIAMEKGFFKSSGIDITDIIGSNGAANDVRNLIAGNLIYADTTLGATVAAIQQGTDLAIVAEHSNNASSNVWVVMPDSPIKSAKDLKGKKIGIVGPQTIGQAQTLWFLDKLGYKQSDVEQISTNGFGPGPVMLENRGIDVAELTYPQWLDSKGKYRAIMAGSDPNYFPGFTNGIGIVSQHIAKARPQAVTAVIEARRKGVVFMHEHRAEAIQIASKNLNTAPETMAKVLDHLMDENGGVVEGVPNFGMGNIYYPAMDNALKMYQLIGVINGKPDLRKMIDESYLPADLKSK